MEIEVSRVGDRLGDVGWGVVEEPENLVDFVGDLLPRS